MKDSYRNSGFKSCIDPRTTSYRYMQKIPSNPNTLKKVYWVHFFLVYICIVLIILIWTFYKQTNRNSKEIKKIICIRGKKGGSGR